MKCKECGAELEKGMQYCSNCGSPITYYCRECKRKVNITQRYCPYCGDMLPDYDELTEDDFDDSLSEENNLLDNEKTEAESTEGSDDDKYDRIYLVIMWILIIGAGLYFANDYFSSEEDMYSQEGYRYACTKLMSPASAQLSGFMSKKEFREEAEKNGIVIPKRMECEIYQIDSQNAFGALLRSKFIVFFWDGEPKFAYEHFIFDKGFWKVLLEGFGIYTGIVLDEDSE